MCVCVSTSLEFIQKTAKEIQREPKLWQLLSLDPSQTVMNVSKLRLDDLQTGLRREDFDRLINSCSVIVLSSSMIHGWDGMSPCDGENNWEQAYNLCKMFLFLIMCKFSGVNQPVGQYTLEDN